MDRIASRAWVVASMVGTLLVGCSGATDSAPPIPERDAAVGPSSSSTGGGGGATGVAGGGVGGAPIDAAQTQEEASTPSNDAAAGAGGGAEASVVVDAALREASPPAADSGATTNPKSYLCNMILGVSVTYDWFTSGFETYLDDARWEAMAPSVSRLAFVENWANASDPIWALAPLSPCTQNAAKPERVIFTGVNWTYTTAAEWVTQLEAVVAVIQTKFPGVKEIDLMTMLRGPGNKACGNNVETVVQPFVDEAVAAVGANHQGLVRVAPKLEVANCDVFIPGGEPHYTPAGKMAVAKIYGESYAKEP